MRNCFQFLPVATLVLTRPYKLVTLWRCFVRSFFCHFTNFITQRHILSFIVFFPQLSQIVKFPVWSAYISRTVALSSFEQWTSFSSNWKRISAVKGLELCFLHFIFSLLRCCCSVLFRFSKIIVTFSAFGFIFTPHYLAFSVFFSVVFLSKRFFQKGL